jgi:hypothetical protein
MSDEVVFFKDYDFITLIQIGPPNLQFVKSKDKNTRAAKDVADSVLSDKSSLVICLSISYYDLRGPQFDKHI